MVCLTGRVVELKVEEDGDLHIALYEPITVTRLPPDLARLERQEEANARIGMAMRW
jgi:hypothetical protein